MKTYRPDGDVLRRFMASKAPVKLIQGPIGSGKSLACAMSVWMKALEQNKQADGRRRCRVHVFRDTYPKLEETTVKTWLDWFPEKEFGRFYWSKPFMHEIRLGDVELDVHFVALEDERAADYFRSLETTMCWFNEVQYMDRLLVDEAISRVGRYPKMIDGGPVGPQVIADLNAPSETHWIPIMRGDVPCPDWFTDEQRQAHKKPAEWEFFVQPAGLVEVRSPDGKRVVGYEENPKAENRSFLPPNYYKTAIAGKAKWWIDANAMNRVSPRRDGKPVFPDFSRDVHVASAPLEPIPEVPLIIGCDFGRQPAAIIGQWLRGSWYILAELIERDMGADRFAPLLKQFLAQHYAGHRVGLWGDPSGDFPGQNDNSTPFKIFRKNKLPIQPAPSNLLTVRLQAVEGVLTRMGGGKPAILFSPTCTTLVAGMDGGYHYRKLSTSGDRYAEEPEKDQYSHPADALQYLLLGGGEGRLLLTGSTEPKKPINTKISRSPFAPGASARQGGPRGW